MKNARKIRVGKLMKKSAEIRKKTHEKTHGNTRGKTREKTCGKTL